MLIVLYSHIFKTNATYKLMDYFVSTLTLNFLSRASSAFSAIFIFSAFDLHFGAPAIFCEHCRNMVMKIIITRTDFAHGKALTFTPHFLLTNAVISSS